MKSNCTTLRENTENEENNNKPVDAGKIGAIPTPAQFPQHVPSRRVCKFFPTDTRSFDAKDPIAPLWWTQEEEEKTALQAEFDEGLEDLLSMIKTALPYISDDDECAYFIQRYRLGELNQHDSRLWEMIDEFGDDVEIIQERWMKFFDVEFPFQLDDEFNATEEMEILTIDCLEAAIAELDLIKYQAELLEATAEMQEEEEEEEEEELKLPAAMIKHACHMSHVKVELTTKVAAAKHVCHMKRMLDELKEVSFAATHACHMKLLVAEVKAVALAIHAAAAATEAAAAKQQQKPKLRTTQQKELQVKRG